MTDLTITVPGTTLYPGEPCVYFSPGPSNSEFYRLDGGVTIYQLNNMTKRNREIAKALLRVALEELEKLDD